jgi:NADPH:quinone reductase-like Zn-dependent oxidoreductase
MTKTQKMKAVVYEKYGPPEVLRLKEIDKPLPKENEVLIKIHATSVSSGDARMRRADPFAVRFMLGLRYPAIKVLGFVFAGEVEVVGEDVTRFRVGDQVYGTSFKKFGTYAEYICLAEDAIIVTKPVKLSYVEAAAIPFGGSTSLHFLRTAKIQSGQRILIYGASGAVGTSAIQVAKYFGAEVTAVCSTGNMALVKSLGADKVIDYTKEDFSKVGILYDIVFDAVGKSPFSASVKSLTKGGHYLRVVHMSLPPVIRGWWISVTTRKKVIGGIAMGTVQDFEFLNKLIDAGHLKPVIDRAYRLEEITEAHYYVEEGHKKGNVVITI